MTYTIKQIKEIFFLSGGSIPSLLIPGKKKIFERNRLSKIFDILTKVETLTLSATSISIIQCDKKKVLNCAVQNPKIVLIAQVPTHYAMSPFRLRQELKESQCLFVCLSVCGAQVCLKH